MKKMTLGSSYVKHEDGEELVVKGIDKDKSFNQHSSLSPFLKQLSLGSKQGNAFTFDV